MWWSDARAERNPSRTRSGAASLMQRVRPAVLSRASSCNRPSQDGEGESWLLNAFSDTCHYGKGVKIANAVTVSFEKYNFR